jgi:hypothetical protein
MAADHHTEATAMSAQLYLVIPIALAAVGFLAGRWLLALVAIALWILGLAIAAIAGAFHQTSLDTSSGLFSCSLGLAALGSRAAGGGRYRTRGPWA